MSRVKWAPPAAWAKMRKAHLLVYPECRACGSREDVIVHHLRYRGRRGCSEHPGDLVTLCKLCHSDLHREFGSAGKLSDQLVFINGRRGRLEFDCQCEEIR